jgi:hypothetical protein
LTLEFQWKHPAGFLLMPMMGPLPMPMLMLMLMLMLVPMTIPAA